MVEVRLASGSVCVSKVELVRFQNAWESVRSPGFMTEAQARAYAAGDRHYVARPDRVGDGWHVWDCVSDHRVEFQEKSNG
jgi:hypothetical protein